jgi:hypothetical protein
MKDHEQTRLESLLARIEYPGEDPRRIADYLQAAGFVDAVMRRVQELARQGRRTLLWGLFAVLNLLLLVLFGTNSLFIPEFFALQAELALFFFLFLGITLLGSLIGLVLSLDTRWLQDLLHRDA